MALESHNFSYFSCQGPFSDGSFTIYLNKYEKIHRYSMTRFKQNLLNKSYFKWEEIKGWRKSKKIIYVQCGCPLNTTVAQGKKVTYILHYLT